MRRGRCAGGVVVGGGCRGLGVRWGWTGEARRIFARSFGEELCGGGVERGEAGEVGARGDLEDGAVALESRAG